MAPAFRVFHCQEIIQRTGRRSHPRLPLVHSNRHIIPEPPARAGHAVPQALILSERTAQYVRQLRCHDPLQQVITRRFNDLFEHDRHQASSDIVALTHVRGIAFAILTWHVVGRQYERRSPDDLHRSGALSWDAHPVTRYHLQHRRLRQTAAPITISLSTRLCRPNISSIFSSRLPIVHIVHTPTHKPTCR